MLGSRSSSSDSGPGIDTRVYVCLCRSKFTGWGFGLDACTKDGYIKYECILGSPFTTTSRGFYLNGHGWGTFPPFAGSCYPKEHGACETSSLFSGIEPCRASLG